VRGNGQDEVLTTPSPVSGVVSSSERNREQEKRRVFLGENLRMSKYVSYEVRMTKDTPTGKRHLVRCNRLGKWAICSWVGSEGNAMGNPECQGNYDYVMKKWKKIQRKRQPVT